MLDSYVKIDDIQKLLDEAQSTNGFINKKEFQQVVTKLKEYRKLPIVKPAHKINKVRDIIGRITAFQNDIQTHKIKSPIREYLENTGIEIEKKDKITIHFFDDTVLLEKDVVLSRNHFMNITGISAPTFSRYLKLRIIDSDSSGAFIYINDINRINIGIDISRYNVSHNEDILKWYNISKFRNNLIAYK